MMPAIESAILALNSSLAASIIVKATVVISLVLTAAWLVRQRRASIRHAVLAAGFAILFALPIAAIIAPPIRIALPMTKHQPVLTDDGPQSAGESPLPPHTSRSAAPSLAGSTSREFSFLDLLFAIWAIAAIIFLAPVVIGLRQVRSLRRTALPWSQGDSIAATLANNAGLHRRVEVLLHESVAGPMTFGVLHPAIVCPVEAKNWNEADLNRAIAHELEHIRRADWLSHCIARVVCAAYWFHPLVWIAWRRLTLDAERSCDDAVLACSEATAYAEQLVALARRLSTATKSPVLAMASRSDLVTRVNAVLDARQPRGRTGHIAIALACVATVFVIAVSPLQLVASAQQATSQDWEKLAGDKMAFDVASVKKNTAAVSADTVRSNITLGPMDWFTPTGGLFSATNYPLLQYMIFAYKLTPSQVNSVQSQLPKWAAGARYDIEARAAGNPSKDQFRLMMQALLADRFKLAVHFENKQVPVYALVLDKPGKLGPQIQVHPADSPCSDASPPPGNAPAGQTSTVAGGLPEQCGAFTAWLPTIPGRLRVGARKVPIAMMTTARSFPELAAADRPIIDETGLAGNYDIVIEYSPQMNGTVGPDVKPDESGPTFLEALKEQLGFRLDKATGGVESIVVDHIEQPTEN